MLGVEVATDLAAALAAARQWDELAVAAGRPFSAPTWMLAWWRHVAPPGGALRIALVRDGDTLVGVVPCHLASAAARVPVLRLLGAGFTARGGPVARAGRETEVARAAAAALGSGPDAPGVVALEGLPGGSPWAELLA